MSNGAREMLRMAFIVQLADGLSILVAKVVIADGSIEKCPDLMLLSPSERRRALRGRAERRRGTYPFTWVPWRWARIPVARSDAALNILDRVEQ